MKVGRTGNRESVAAGCNVAWAAWALGDIEVYAFDWWNSLSSRKRPTNRRKKIESGDVLLSLSEKIWQEYSSRLRAFIKSKISDDAAADDILQDVFLKMHVGLTSLRDEKKIKNWLFQITRNTIIDYFRSQKPSEHIPEWLSMPESDFTENVHQELAGCLHPMIKALPEKYREAVMLSELNGLKQKEVARLLGISVSAAKSRVQRGRALLKQMLNECCRFEFDHRGRIIEYERKGGPCDHWCR